VVSGGGTEAARRAGVRRSLPQGQTRTGEFSWSVEAILRPQRHAALLRFGNGRCERTRPPIVDNQALVAASIGRNFTPWLQLAYVVRPRYVRGAAGGAARPALDREHCFRHSRASAASTSCSTAPCSPTTPVIRWFIRTAGRATSFTTASSAAPLASSVSYRLFGAKARHYWAFGPDVTLAWHAAARYMPAAGNAPFWALSSLGGDRSVTAEREPLRGYGADRFIDRNMFATA